LQQARHRADYDRAISAFHAWKEIKDADLAQDYLYSLLFKDRNF
jgi:hypothetical protein